MNDLIDRQMAIDTIMGQPPEPHYPSWYAAQIEKLPAVQPEPHWIPCGERLPEEKQSVLVTDGSVVWVCDIISTDEGYKWEDSHGYWLDLDEWTAWRPLPEPYRGGEK